MSTKTVRFNLFSVEMNKYDYNKFDSLSEALNSCNSSIELPLTNIVPPDTLVMPMQLISKLNGEIVAGAIAFKQRSMIEFVYNSETKKNETMPNKFNPMHSTCFLYDKTTGIIIIESVQRGKGPGVRQVCDYLSSSCGLRSLSHLTVPNPNELKKLEEISEIRGVEIILAKPNHDSAQKQPLAMKDCSDLADDWNGDRITVEVTGKRMNYKRIMDSVRAFLKLDDSENNELKKFRLSGVNGDNDSRIVDILSNRILLEAEIPRTVNKSIGTLNEIINVGLRKYKEVRPTILKQYSETKRDRFFSE